MAAKAVVGTVADRPYDDRPTYWTEQYDLTVNACGPTELADEVQVRGDLEGADFVAYLRGGRLVAGLACGQHREYGSLRRLLLRGVPVTSTDVADPAVTFAELAAEHPPPTPTR
ncbi:MAG: oxidoreductase C-terminal domain-containing protein [Ilumatobacteraceae bacterium]